MTLPSHLPHLLWLLCFALPGVLFAGWALASGSTKKGRLRVMLSPGLAGVAWLATTHIAGRILKTYTGAVLVGTLVPALSGCAFMIRQRMRGARSPSVPFGRWYSPWMLVSMAVGTALMFPAAWNWCFHDEPGATGHLSLIFEMQRNIYPPRNLTFPRLEMPYHYGFDVAAAFVSEVLRIDPQRGIDVVTLVSWAYSWCLFWALGDELFGRRGGPTCAFLTLIGGGFPYYCGGTANAATTLAGHILNVCLERESLVNPTVSSYFFQHPWGFGIPIVGLIGVWLVASRFTSLVDGAVAILILIALDISQFAAWTATMPILAATMVLGTRWRDRRQLLVPAITLGAAFSLARMLGGFWANHHAGAFSLHLHAGINQSFSSSVLWNLRTFGPLLVGLLGLPFFERGNRPRAFFAMVAVGGLLIVNLFVYGRSWDIVKFATFASLGFGVTSSGVIVRWLRSRLVLVRIGAVAVLLLAGLSTAGFLLVVDLDLAPTSVTWIFGCAAGMVGPDFEAARWLRSHMRPEDVMYRRADVSPEYVTYGGIAQIWMGNAYALPIPDEVIAARSKLISDLPEGPEPYRGEGIRFFVLDGTEGKIGAIVHTWETKGTAHERARFGGLRIVELV